jgi:hypothetical protein
LILKRKVCRIEDDLLNGNKRDECSCSHHSWLPELGKEVFQAQGGVLGCPIEGELEDSLVDLKLLAEEKLVESLVKLKLLAEEKLDPSLVRLKFLLEKRMAGSLVKQDLKHVEEKNSPRFGSPKFPL